MDQGSRDGLSRRRMLQAAVAGGVGAAAWTAPQIKTLGFKPAYADVCSLPADVTTHYSTAEDVGCPALVSGRPHVVRLNDEVKFGPGNAHSVSVSGNERAVETNHFVVDAAGLRCRVRSVELWDRSGALYGSWPVDAGDPQPVPRIGQAGGAVCPTTAGVFTWSVTVDCVPEGECFPGEEI